MIRLRDVHKRYGRIHAVRGVSFEVKPGSIVGILGPNGAGKTTTIRMITGTVPPSEGDVTVDGLDSIAHSRAVRRRIGYLPESAPLYREMPVRSFLDYRAALYELPRRDRRLAVDRAIERCWLADVRTRPIGTLSKGYRQRVGLAAALIHRPPLLILDEPTSGLDPLQIAETRRLVRELAGDHTMLLISHILPEVEKTCDRILVFASGRIRADGHPDELVRRLAPRTGYVVEWKPARDDPSAALHDPTAIPGAISAESSPALPGPWQRTTITFDPNATDAPERIARFAHDHALIIRELHPNSSSLEELYLRLIEMPEEGTLGTEAAA